MQAQTALQDCLDMVSTQIEAMEYLHGKLVANDGEPPLYLVGDVIDAQLSLARLLSQDRPPLRLMVDNEGEAVSARLIALCAQMDMMVSQGLLAGTVASLVGDLQAMRSKLINLSAQ